MKTYKKYKNRKIYDTTKSEYVTVVDIAIKSLEEPVQVVEQASGKDMTTESLLAGFTQLLDLESKAKIVELAQKLYNEKGLSQNLTDVAREEVQNV